MKKENGQMQSFEHVVLHAEKRVMICRTRGGQTDERELIATSQRISTAARERERVLGRPRL